jgi:hypothetical protein
MEGGEDKGGILSLDDAASRSSAAGAAGASAQGIKLLNIFLLSVPPLHIICCSREELLNSPPPIIMLLIAIGLS